MREKGGGEVRRRERIKSFAMKYEGRGDNIGGEEI
jgi:hypothetical protein